VIKLTLLLLTTVLFGITLKGQIFPANSGVPVDLDAGSTNYSSCASPGNKSNIQFNVSGVGTLTPTHALSKVDLQFNAACGSNLRDVALYIKSPSGTCMRIYSGSGLGTSFSGLVNLSMRDGACLNEPNSSNLSTTATTNITSSGNYGAFAANSTLDMSSVFNGENADGTWTIYAFESTISAPCVNSVTLEFGNPTVVDKSSDGETCSTPVLWQGGPICASTMGKAPSALMPGSLTGGTNFGTIGGSICSWNGNNNNDVWIKFSPSVTGNICILISGAVFNMQTIVVTDANTDADNDPCTYTGPFPNPAGNDPRWNLVSCPTTSGIYATTSGSQLCQQHCFNANAGQIYYLVVDGNGGVESSFYITGNLGSFNPLPIELVYFKGWNTTTENEIIWKTALETNNSFFDLEKSTNGYDFTKIASLSSKSTNGLGAEYNFTDKNLTVPKNYYRLKQTDIDGKSSYSKLIEIVTSAQFNPKIIVDEEMVKFLGIDQSKRVQISLLDINGRIVHSQSNTESIHIANYPKSVYLLKIVNGLNIKYQKIIN
jgi:hypothetical protein